MSSAGDASRTVIAEHLQALAIEAGLREESIMLSWALTFLILALLAAVFGFGMLSGVAMTAAKICFFVFLVLAVISLIAGRRVNV